MPEHILELIQACEDRVTRLLVPNVDDSMPHLRVNDNQCKYLAEKLKLVVSKAHIYSRDLEGSSTITQEDVRKCRDNFKLLRTVACSVESFIEKCCEDAWVAAAFLLPNMSQDVLSLTFELELLARFFSGILMVDVEAVYRAEASVVTEKAHSDGDLLIEKVKAVLSATQKSSAEFGLAEFLLKRLETPGVCCTDSKKRLETPGVYCTDSESWTRSGYTLGKGASAKVYKAKWLGIDVALKTFPFPGSKDFEKEVSVVGGLSHPNLASILCCAKDDRECSIVIELMECDLYEMIRDIMTNKSRTFPDYPFSIYEAVGIMLQVGNGVEYLHGKKIVHRDLKAANILVKQLGPWGDGESKSILAKVADFGLSTTKEKSMTYSKQTSNTGTARWMAPEVIQMTRTEELEEVSKDTKVMNYPYGRDAFSFGMVCYEILTGNLPYFKIESPNQVKRKILSGERPQLPKHCIPDLKDLILRCWSEDVSKRPRFDEICVKLRNIRFQLLLSDSQQRIVSQLAIRLRGEPRIVVGLDTVVANAQDANNSLNVLLLGPTGVGKSTFINALCNYLVYPSLDEALTKDDVLSVIYSEFATSAFENGKIVKKSISVGKKDPDESATTKGASVTQKCKAYNIVVGDGSRSIRLIDTPGIGDTRGFDQDVKNMNDIMSFIAQYEELNAVCILLKPNEERLTGSLSYCIVQLLQKLRKDASRNILFCFTNSRSTFYRPGNTLFLVQEMLKLKLRDDMIELSIKLDDPDTLYHFDSEGFRFLASAKNGIEFLERETRDCKDSWVQSSEEAARLISHIAQLEPHMIQDTLSLNRVRVMLESMEVPLRDIFAAIQKNLGEVRRKRNEVEVHRGAAVKNNASVLRTEEYLKTVPLEHPRLKCTNLRVCGSEVCHNKCSPTERTMGLVEDILGSKMDLARSFYNVPEDTVFCKKLSMSSGKCRTCGCYNDCHIRETTERVPETRTVEDPAIRLAINERISDVEKNQKILTILEVREESFKAEYNIVLRTAALFAGFLAQNSIITHHSAISQLLKQQIKETRGDPDRLKELKGMLDSYENFAQQFMNLERNDNKRITVEDVDNEVKKLFALDLHGDQLKAWSDGIESKLDFQRVEARRRTEVAQVVPAPSGKSAGDTGRNHVVE